MNSKVYIYGLTDEYGIIRYVGKTINPNQRYSAHISSAKNKKTHKECWLYGLLIKGIKPKMIILEECSENWHEREKYHIKMYYNLTNLTDGGDGVTGIKMSDETKKKMSEQKKGEKNNFFGKQHTLESKKIISDKNKEYLKNNPNSFLNKKHTDVTKNILSELGKKRWLNGYLHLPPVMKGIDNPSTKKRIFISPNNEFYTVYNTKKFCNENNLSYKIVLKYINKGKIMPPTDKKTLDRQRFKSLNTIGWEINE
jgi:group I intron endonuclease